MTCYLCESPIIGDPDTELEFADPDDPTFPLLRRDYHAECLVVAKVGCDSADWGEVVSALESRTPSEPRP